MRTFLYISSDVRDMNTIFGLKCCCRLERQHGLLQQLLQAEDQLSTSVRLRLHRWFEGPFRFSFPFGEGSSREGGRGNKGSVRGGERAPLQQPKGGDFRALFLKTEQLNERKSKKGQLNDFKINMQYCKSLINKMYILCAVSSNISTH